MSVTDKLSADEFALLAITPSMIGSTIAFSESSGVIGTLKEMFASAKGVLAGQEQYPDNELVQAILPNLEDREEALAQAKRLRELAQARLKEKHIDSRDKLEAQVVEDCRAISALLDEKFTREEASQYREWVMAVGERVARAAKEGGFLGIGGEQVSSGEVRILNRIAEALGASTRIT